ncbi:MAG: RidA family protein [Candidatus Acinetobacter avistercoris]|nr:RidA family protein [Candidatus Acinetobacter avistercoris]
MSIDNQNIDQQTKWISVKNNALPAAKFKYTPVVLAGDFIFVSGLIGLDRETGRLVEGGLSQQTRQILKNLENLCLDINVELKQLMLTRVYCTDFSEFHYFNDVWEEFFKEKIPPARTSLGVSALPLGALIEMEFQFVV